MNCKGAATPKPPTNPPKPPTNPPTQPPPTYAPQPSRPPYAPQSPTYAPQPPITIAPQLPSYQPQPQPSKPPTYQPQPYPPPPPSYPSNSWLSKAETDPWHQRQPASQLEIQLEKERRDQEAATDGQLSDNQSADVTEMSSLTNPWTIFQVVPPELMNAACNDGDVHRLNDMCTNVVVCRNNRPQMVRCSTGFSYDKPSDSCRPFSIAKW